MRGVGGGRGRKRRTGGGKTDRDYAAAAAAESLQSCPTLCDPIDGSPPGSSVHVLDSFQARVLEWGAIAFSRQRLYRPSKPETLPSPLQRMFTHVCSGGLMLTR